MSGARQAGASSLSMQSENFGYSRVRLRRIKKLQFGVVNPNELVRAHHSWHCCVWPLLQWVGGSPPRFLLVSPCGIISTLTLPTSYCILPTPFLC